MTYPLLKFAHLGLTLMGAGLIGVWCADLRSRQVRELPLLAEAHRRYFDVLLTWSLDCLGREGNGPMANLDTWDSSVRPRCG
jgi:hypothetical protein